MKYIVSDNISVKGFETAAGSKTLAGYKPVFDADIVKFLNANGHEYAGSVSCGEFCTDVTPLAKAVSEGKAEIGVCTDTFGKIFETAQKFGLEVKILDFSRDGIIPYSSSLDKLYIIGKNSPLGRGVTAGDGVVKNSAATLIISSAELASNVSRIDGIRYGFRAENFADIDEMIENSRIFSYDIKLKILLGNYVLLAENYERLYKTAKEVLSR